MEVFVWSRGRFGVLVVCPLLVVASTGGGSVWFSAVDAASIVYTKSVSVFASAVATLW